MEGRAIIANIIVQSIALDFQKKRKEKKKMEEKRFDSAEKIMEALKEQKIRHETMYIGFIDAIYERLLNHQDTINGAPSEDFFIQGLIAIAGDPEAFKTALSEFMDIFNMKY